MSDASSPTPWWQRLRLQARPAARHCLPTGHALLDAALPGGGWLAGQVLEVCSPQVGEAEWRLLADAIRRGVQEGRPLALVQPPRSLPHDPRLSLLDRHLTCCWPGADPRGIVEAGLLWLRAHPAGLLVLWAQEMSPPAWRALSRAARRHAAHVLVVRPALTRWDDSPAEVRLSLLPGRGRHWEVRVQTPASAAAVLVRVSLDDDGLVNPPTGLASTSVLKVAVDPEDRRRTALCGTLAQVCDELERLARREDEGWPLAA
ncbi:MAG: hypothetical protein ACK4ZD_10875 [Caldimonas sp.]|uniref:hypothetical protein n=1 Tax=Caldimonas sp. TaxID=2838790 RepID=UPI00391CBB99